MLPDDYIVALVGGYYTTWPDQRVVDPDRAMMKP